MIPGEYFLADGDVVANEGRRTVDVTVENTGDRPIQVGSHFHFFEVNRALRFDRQQAFGMQLDVPAGTAVRFEPGDAKRVTVHDARGPILHDRFVLAGPPAWDGLGVTESHAYFGSIVVVADVDLAALARALDAVAIDGFIAAAARLGRRGVVLRCLATAAPALTAGIDEAWACARAALGRPRLALRKT